MPNGSGESQPNGLSAGKYGNVYANGGKREGDYLIPELAVTQLTEEQRQLVRPFAIPRPTRQVVLATNKDFIRHSLLSVLKEEIKAAVPKEMLSLQSIQCLL